jgi:peptide/nickel transport system substrate-binding protein
MFKSYNPNRSLVMVRNPFFKEWSVKAQPDGYPDQITQTFGLTVEAQVTAIQNGQADWTLEQPPADRLSEIGTKYASQVHVTPLTAFWYIPMNTNMAPFNKLKARQAFNFAVDRNAAVKIFGGKNLASPSCQVLPPGFPGHKDYCPYTKNPGTKWSAPDVAKAKKLVKESGTLGQKVTVVVPDDEVNKAMGVYTQSVLNQIGYKASVKAISGNIFFTFVQNTKNKVQINVQQWYQDYPAASDFLNILFGCDSFHPGSDSSINIAGFCDKKIDAQMKHALALASEDENAANAEWTKIDHAVTDAAPMATLFNPKHVDFVSKRVGNFTFSKQFYWLVSQSWVK